MIVSRHATIVHGHGLLTPDETSFIADMCLPVDGGDTAE
jgi:hypothetical protein